MQVESRLEIAASTAVVWDVTIDVARWPAWSPTFESVRRLEDGAFAHGSRAAIRQPGLAEATWTVTDFDDGKRFTWDTHVRGMHMLATHELTPTDHGTLSVLRLEMRGFVACLLWPLARIAIRRSLERENAALKVECERG